MTARGLLSVSAIVVAGMLGCSSAEAGFFDEIGEMFGGRAARYYAPREPMYIRVYPRRPRFRPRSVRKEMTRPETVKAAVIDPAKDPQWFLHDPTLRRGDMVVLPGGVFVFDGRGSAKEHDREDFVSLKDSRDVPKATRQLVEKMATVPSRSQLVGSDAAIAAGASAMAATDKPR